MMDTELIGISDVANTKVFNVYFNVLPVLFNRYYLKNNLGLSERETEGITLMFTDASNTGFPPLFPYNGVNYTNVSAGALLGMFITFCDAKGHELHSDIPASSLTPSIRKNYKFGGAINYDKSFVYWVLPPLTVNNVLPFKIEYK